MVCSGRFSRPNFVDDDNLQRERPELRAVELETGLDRMELPASVSPV